MDTLGGRLGHLVERAAAGNRGDLEELLQELWTPVLRYLARWLAGRREGGETAEDLAQDVLVRLAQGIGECRARTDTHVQAWALTAARNRAFDYLRASSRVPTARGAPEWLEELAEPFGPPPPLSPRLSSLLEQFRVVYDSLPPLTQGVLWHRLVQGDSWEVVASELRITHRSAQRRFQHVQAKLRRRALSDGLLVAPLA
jgi:RNA polymerase sigma factor (sigma-70 family)